MGEGREQANSSGRAPDRVTIGQAAALLGVHPNTIRNRVRAGVYEAEKVVTENGQTWMIERNSLLNKPLPKGSQQTPLQRQPETGIQTTAIVRELLRPFVEDLGRVREELGAERVRREQAERERDELAAQLSELRETPGSPESADEPSDTAEPRSSTEEQQEVTSRPQERSWWRRMLGS
jgi:hypothetical protein